jgi:hypothetical protein
LQTRKLRFATTECSRFVCASNFDLSISYITRFTHSDIVRKRTVVLQTKVCSGIIFAYISTREANTTWLEPNITAQQYHSPKANITAVLSHR